MPKEKGKRTIAAMPLSSFSTFWRRKDYAKCYDTKSPTTMATCLEWLLKKRTGQIPKPGSLARHQDVLDRLDRNLLRYHVCGRLRLRTFVSNRGLSVPPKIRATNTLLIRTLESAGDNWTFDRFFDLAPELRTMVYEFHIRSLTCDSWCLHIDKYITGVPMVHCQPALTIFSRHVREYALAHFYSSCTFNCITDMNYGQDVKTDPTIDLNKVPAAVFEAMKISTIRI